MTQLVFTVLCVFIVTIYAAELKCGPGEVVEDCPNDCDMEYCPKNENYSQSCDKPIKCLKPVCKCGFNYSRAENGTCISTRDCSPFPCTRPNEEYSSCPPYCPNDDCSQATPDGRCPTFGHILIVVECKPTCRCKKGYWRNKGLCVPYAECPNHGDITRNDAFWQIFT